MGTLEIENLETPNLTIYQHSNFPKAIDKLAHHLHVS